MWNECGHHTNGRNYYVDNDANNGSAQSSEYILVDIFNGKEETPHTAGQRVRKANKFIVPYCGEEEHRWTASGDSKGNVCVCVMERTDVDVCCGVCGL